eukprot:991665-Lingulodinium_polyedra.AAC.1
MLCGRRNAGRTALETPAANARAAMADPGYDSLHNFEDMRLEPDLLWRRLRLGMHMLTMVGQMRDNLQTWQTCNKCA